MLIEQTLGLFTSLCMILLCVWLHEFAFEMGLLEFQQALVSRRISQSSDNLKPQIINDVNTWTQSHFRKSSLLHNPSHHSDTLLTDKSEHYFYKTSPHDQTWLISTVTISTALLPWMNLTLPSTCPKQTNVKELKLCTQSLHIP